MAPSESSVVAENAKSNRSTCKKCSEAIQSKTLRLGLVTKDKSRGFDVTKWHHLTCFPVPSSHSSIDKITGFSSLKSGDQEALTKLFTEQEDNSEEASKKTKGIQNEEQDGEERDSKKTKNMAAWLVGLNTLKIQPFNLPSLGPHDVRIKMKAVGICGSDVHYLKTLRCADFIVKEPMVIGHECAGIIEEVGSQVRTLVPGDRVAIEPGISCWRCDHCKLGRYNLCPDMKFFATPPVHGSLANQIVHPADLCFKLPENVSLEEGAMCEPLSVGVHACRRANIGPETNVLIMGAGPIGLVTMLSARAFGAPRIVVVDVDDHRLSVAKSLGADDIVKVSTNIQDVAEEVKQIHNVLGAGVDVTFDCAGFNKTMTTALTATQPGGKVCLVGMGHSEMTVPLTPAAAREVDVVGIFRYKNTWPLCLEFLRSGKIDVKPLITHRFGFSQKEVEEAFETSARGGNAIKVMFNL